jgi:hypothetical protein
MTPQEEQAAMQAYVRQRLAAQGGQLNLVPGQLPLASEDQQQFLQRPPIAPGTQLPATPGPAGFSNNAAVDATRGGLVPGVQGDLLNPGEGQEPGTVGMEGGVSPRRLRDLRGALNSRFMVRQKVPF